MYRITRVSSKCLPLISSKSSIFIQKSFSKTKLQYFSSKLQQVPKNIMEKDYQTITEMFLDSTKEYALLPCLGTLNLTQDKYNWLNYLEIQSQVDEFHKVLKLHKIEKNDKIALISNNRIEWAISTYAAMFIGAQVVPMYEAQLEKDW